jgi:protein-disulfide isomerase
MSSRPPQGTPGPARSAREAAREQAARARAEEEARRRRERTVRITAIAVVVLLVVGGTVFAVLRSRVDQGAPLPAGVSAQGGPIVVGGSGSGSAAKVPVLDIFEDFQCPYCQQFEAANGALVTQYAQQGKIQARYHVVSFLGPESVRAANAAGCAADGGKFPAFHATLYANQPKEGTGGYTNDQLIAFGAKVGLTSQDFQQCVRDSTYAAWVKAVQHDFDTRGLRGTPTVILDGKTIDPTQYEPATFKALLDAAAK